MVVGDMNIYFKSNSSYRRWVKREAANSEEGSEDSAFGVLVWGYSQADDCLALAHVSEIHHSVHIHSILDLSPLSFHSGINIF